MPVVVEDSDVKTTRARVDLISPTVDLILMQTVRERERGVLS